MARADAKEQTERIAAALERIADTLEKIEKMIDCGSAMWGRGV